jgi:tyrosyl-DNA phosphodiesterase 2
MLRYAISNSGFRISSLQARPALQSLRRFSLGIVRLRRNTAMPLSTQKTQFSKRDNTQPITPEVFRNFSWKPGTGMDLLKRQSLLKVVSWNIDFASPGPTERVTSILEYLQNTFGNSADQLAILLQEVCPNSAEKILQNKWVQQNFTIIGQEPPQIFQAGIPRPARYFTMAMIPKLLRVKGAFRMPLPSEMGRDALFVDLTIQPTTESDGLEEVFRLCTTHLESLAQCSFLRARQLKQITEKLKEDTQTAKVVASLLGGDMNALDPDESTLHRQVGLRDAWEDGLSLCTTSSGDSKIEISRVGGHTWGHQSNNNKRNPKRLDKFFYTGDLKTLPFMETREIIEMVGQLGVGLTARVPLNKYPDKSTLLTDTGNIKTVWVSDHFGIALGVEIVN